MSRAAPPAPESAPWEPPPGVMPSDLTRCMAALLDVSGWQGAPRDLIRALPHAAPRPDLTDIRNALATLGYPTQAVARRGAAIDPRRLPALLVPRRGPVSLLWRDAQGRVLRYDGGDGRVRLRGDRPARGRLYAVTAPEAPPRREGWVGRVLRRFQPEAGPLLVCSALIALAGLAGPIFVMTAFNLVSGAREAGVLPALALGAAGALAAEAGFRALRRTMLARIGERLDWLVATGVFAQLMALPPALVEGAGRAAQVSRIRDFAGIREFLTGAFAVAALDLPMSLLALALLAALGGWIALAPLAAAAGFGLLHLATRGPMQRAVAAAAEAGQTRDALALEALEAQRALKLGAAEGRWADRWAETAARAAAASARTAALGGDVMLLAQALVTLTALAAATAGVAGVLAGSMNAGALIAGMMLIWRVLGPLQSGFVMLSRWRQTLASIRQVDAMMSLQSERPPAGEARRAAPIGGGLQFRKVALRFPGRADPILAGASFEVAAGEMVALTGAAGSGKSTLLRLAAGLHAPQSGAVRVDGHDARAYDPAALRRAMAWAPQTPDMIYGTIAQNLRLARPDADDAALRRALDGAHALEAVAALPLALETRIADNAAQALPRSLLVRLTLARALLSEAPFLLLDEAVAGLDDAAADAFAATIAARRGRATILMASHRPSHIRLADRVLHLEDGQVEARAAPRPAPTSAPVVRRAPIFRAAVAP